MENVRPIWDEQLRSFVFTELPDNPWPGVKVTSQVVNYFRDLLPPACDCKNLMQIGSPYSHIEDPRTGKWRGVFSTFKRISADVWEYCGHCFINESVPAVQVK